MNEESPNTVRTQPRFCMRERISFDAPPNCWCEAHRAAELTRILAFEKAIGHRRERLVGG